MGLFDKAKDLAGENSDKVDQGVESAGDFVDDKTGGQHADKVDQAQNFANDQFGGGDQGGEGN
ncbi:antitoxin [Demetria terragena]|uniref:antitoxin n=1 Tax=Demetria terragena TaxID=63959 RepID=UPI000361536C|nr:antitoxin [Demetria terragena]